MDARELRDRLLIPNLQELATACDKPAMASPSAVALLLLTCAVESNMGTFVRQRGYGLDVLAGAWGPFQQESISIAEQHRQFGLRANRKLATGVLRGHYLRFVPPNHDSTTREFGMGKLMECWHTAIVCARLHYWWASADPIPPAGDVVGLGEYWKKFHNTAAGAGTVTDAVVAWDRHDLGVVVAEMA